MSFSIVIPTYNHAQNLRNLLESLEKLDIPEDTQWEVLVVDNNSTDCTREVVDEFIERKTLFLHYFFEKEQGSSHARNKGIKEARGQIVAFVDDDTVVERRWLCALKSFFERFDCIGMGGRVLVIGTEHLPKWINLNTPYKIAGVMVRHDKGDDFIKYNPQMIMPITANLAIKKVAFEKYGYFKAELGKGLDTSIVAGEDTELCQRLLKHGETLIYSPEAIVYHPVTQNRVSKRYCRKFYFWLGRGMAQRADPPTNVFRILNVPKHVFRELVVNAIRYLGSLVALEFSKLFYYELHLILVMGKIFQFVSMQKQVK